MVPLAVALSQQVPMVKLVDTLLVTAVAAMMNITEVVLAAVLANTIAT